MQSGKFYIGKPVYSLATGRKLGTVKDLYLDSNLTTVAGLYLGTESLLNRTQQCINRGDVAVFGVDAILATHDDVVIGGTPGCEAQAWLRRDELPGRTIKTAGGTQVGTISDIILDEMMQIAGIQLGRIFVAGPVSENRAIVREAITEVGNGGPMIVDLPTAERQDLHAV